MKYKISHAKFHEGIFFPGFGDLGKALPSTSKTLNDLEMTFEDGVLEVSARGSTLLIPAPNIIAMFVSKTQTTPTPSGKVDKAPTVVTVNTKSGNIKSN